jgi:hypothetical protein
MTPSAKSLAILVDAGTVSCRYMMHRCLKLRKEITSRTRMAMENLKDMLRHAKTDLVAIVVELVG